MIDRCTHVTSLLYVFTNYAYIHQGKSIKLDGSALRKCLTEKSVKDKTILVSFEETKSGRDEVTPGFLQDRPHFYAEDDDVFDNVMCCIVAER